MKNIYTLLFTLLFATAISAQSGISGCDGVRYVQPVFTDYDVDIVNYGSNINQGGSTAIPLYMDVYTPKNDNATKRPVVVVAHGGTFIFGEKNDMAATCIEFVKRGYVAVTIQYRLYSVFSLGIPDSVKLMRQSVMAMGDMKAAIRYLREDAATVNKYKIHPDWIFSGGYSAGAITALHVAQLDSTDQMPTFVRDVINNLGGINGNTGTASNRTYSSSVKGVVNMSGGLYEPTWIDSNDLPMFSIHGTADQTVFYTSGLAANIINLHGSGNLHTRAQQVNVPSKLRTVQGAGHTDLYQSTTYAAEMSAFFNETSLGLNNLFCPGSVDTDQPTPSYLSWRIYPNPVSEQVLIELPESIQMAGIEVFSASGKSMLYRNITTGSTLSLGHLPAGLYFVRAQADGQNLQSRSLSRSNGVLD